MLRIVLKEQVTYDEETNRFGKLDSKVLQFEHSLVSVSKWEYLFEKPFLTKEPRTQEELIAYVKCMSLDEIEDEDVRRLSKSDWEKLNDHISSSTRTATTFGGPQNKQTNNAVVTSELIYYWMVALQIPIETENWHLNRLIALIRIGQVKGSTGQKMSKSEVLSENRRLNEERRAAAQSKG